MNKVDPRWADARRMLDNGHSKADITKKYGVSYGAVEYWLFRHSKSLRALEMEPNWTDSLSTRTKHSLYAEFDSSVVRDKSSFMRAIVGVNLMKVPNIGRKAVSEIEAALGQPVMKDDGGGPIFNIGHARACIAYLEKWGYTVTPPSGKDDDSRLD